MLPQSFLDELTARNDIVDVVGSYVTLTQKGSVLFGLCPFHNEKTPSFSVTPGKQICYCYGCKKGGSVINFIMEVENLSYIDAIRFLAKRVNMDVPNDRVDNQQEEIRKRLLNLNRDAARFFYQNLQGPEGKAVQAYLDKRKIRKQIAMNFGMGASLDSWDSLLTAMTRKGYTKSELLQAGLVSQNRGHIYDKFRNRLMLPVVDVRGDIVGFGSRVIDNSEPKYMNTTETPVYSKRRVLYGMNLAKKSKRGNIILCEGNLDVVTLHQAGFDNAVASMGTALTTEQIQLLSRYTKDLILCYDNDNAGQMATQKALELLEKTEMQVKVLKLPNKMVDGQPTKQDADDFIKNYGSQAFENLLNGSADGAEFRLTQIAGKYDLKDDPQRVAYARECADFLASIENSVERDVYTVRAAQAAELPPDVMRQEVSSAFKRKISNNKRKQERREMNVTINAQPADRSIRYTNLRSAMAEEGVIRLLQLDDKLFPEEAPIREEEFSSPILGRIFRLLWENREHSGNFATLSGALSKEEMNHLMTILQKPESLSNAEQSLSDYIRIIKDESEKRDGAENVDPLIAAMNKYKNKKQYGGKN